jgi:hypothetical protein
VDALRTGGGMKVGKVSIVLPVSRSRSASISFLHSALPRPAHW